METWKPVVGYEDRYEVSSDGQVRSLDIYVNCKNGKRLYKGRAKPQYTNNRGYLVVSLCRENESSYALVHRLVAEAFVPNAANKPQVNHIDGCISNNNASNLEWVTDDENKIHSSIAAGGTQRPKRAVMVKDLATGIERVFDGIREAERHLGLDHKSSLQVVQGKARQTKGYTLCYV